jgi:hypothetical protein
VHLYWSECHVFVTEVYSAVVSKPFVIPTSKSRPSRTSEPVDIAARYFVYKLYDATSGNPLLWHPVRAFREAAETVRRAVERGWVVVRDEGTGRAKQTCAVLTDEGRLMARKGLR